MLIRVVQQALERRIVQAVSHEAGQVSNFGGGQAQRLQVAVDIGPMAVLCVAPSDDVDRGADTTGAPDASRPEKYTAL